MREKMNVNKEKKEIRGKMGKEWNGRDRIERVKNNKTEKNRRMKVLSLRKDGKGQI